MKTSTKGGVVFIDYSIGGVEIGSIEFVSPCLLQLAPSCYLSTLCASLGWLGQLGKYSYKYPTCYKPLRS